MGEKKFKSSFFLLRALAGGLQSHQLNDSSEDVLCGTSLSQSVSRGQISLWPKQLFPKAAVVPCPLEGSCFSTLEWGSHALLSWAQLALGLLCHQVSPEV